VTAQEFQHAFNNFQDNVRRIEQKNLASKSATFSLNKFSDLSPAEFKAAYLMKSPIPTSQQKIPRPLLPRKIQLKDLPTKFDWRDRQVVTAVKDQGQCGSCWAFSVTETVESSYMLKNNITVDKMSPLAPQQLVDCDDFDLGCNGGNPSFTYEYLELYGLEKESDYPYTAKDGTCAYSSGKVFTYVKSWWFATWFANEDTLKQNLVQYGPLSICLDAENWDSYQSGVMTSSQCCEFCSMDHCVQLVGYDTTATVPYWIVRNSWGTNWGNKGYIWLEMGKNTCLMTEEATYVSV